MVNFVIIELADGLTVVEVQPGERPEDAAISHGGCSWMQAPMPPWKRPMTRWPTWRLKTRKRPISDGCARRTGQLA